MRTFASCDVPVRIRGIRFAKAAAFARKMEQSAKMHYNGSINDNDDNNTSYEWPDKFFGLKDYQGVDDNND